MPEQEYLPENGKSSMRVCLCGAGWEEWEKKYKGTPTRWPSLHSFFSFLFLLTCVELAKVSPLIGESNV